MGVWSLLFGRRTLSTISQASRRRLRARRDRHRRRRQYEDKLSRVTDGPPSQNLRRQLMRVALIGVPNTGKSTLFNRLTKQKRRRGVHAIVNPVPGTTRDYREGAASIGDLKFELVDTGGLEMPATKHHRNRHGDAGSRGEMEEYGSPVGIQTSMLGLTESVMHNIDVALFMLDGRCGVTPMDEHFARWVRRVRGRVQSQHTYAFRSKRPLKLVRPVVNKMEGWSSDSPLTHQLIADTNQLGFGDPVFISAEHGDGLADLFDTLVDIDEAYIEHELGCQFTIPVHKIEAEGQDEPGAMTKKMNLQSAKPDVNATIQRADEKVTDAELPANCHEPYPSENVIQICIVGRPNTGKSTLTNALVGQNRVLTGPTPGLTRDPVRLDIDFDVSYFDYENEFSIPKTGLPDRLRIIDTAGVRRPGKRDHTDGIESKSVAESMHALKFSHVVAVVLDAQMPPTRMDLALIGKALDEGRAVVLVANKIDLVETQADVEEICSGILEKVTGAIPQARGATVVPMSALHGHGIDSLFPVCADAYRRWDQRITTAVLNQFIAAIQRHTPPPRGAKIQYVSQVQHRPPKFILFTSGRKSLPEHYERFLANSLRDEFDLGGVPIRLKVKPKPSRVTGFHKRSGKGKFKR